MQTLSKPQLIELIRNRGEHYQNIDDELESHAAEQEVIELILEYMDKVGIEVPGLKLRALLEAEDDESEGVPPEGVDATVMDLIERIQNREHPEHLDTPPDVKELWDEFYRAFWPLYFED